MKKFSDFLEGRCWPGYKPKPGKKAYSPGSCVKESAAAAIAAATAIAKKKSGNYDSEGMRKTPYKNPDSPNRKSNAERRAELKEDLRKWFSKTAPEGGWKRINSKGEAIGPCAREPGEPKPKCMSNEKRAQLSKKERASAVASKRRNDPNPERQGKPINVSNFGKGKISEDMENLDEKNVPTSPEKWAQAKAQAKAKFDVYPSAYANGWASKKYKEMGGGWKSVSEAKDEQEYGYEGDMAMNQLATLTRCADMIKEMLKPDTDLPEWVQSKITLDTDYIQTAADYLYSEMKEEVESIEEAEKTFDFHRAKEKHHENEGDKAMARAKSFGAYAHPSGIAARKTAEKHYAKADEHRAAYKAMGATTVKENVEQIEEISDNLAGNYLKKVNDNLIKKVGFKPDLYNHLEPKRQKGATRALDRLMKPVKEENKPEQDTPAKASLMKRSEKPTAYVHEGAFKQMDIDRQETERLAARKKSGAWSVEGKWKVAPATVTDKSGAKHTPMSRARSLARDAAKHKMAEQSNVQPNPFTVPEINIGKAPKKKKVTESRQANIIREAMKDARKKNAVKKEEDKMTNAGSDKFIADPELSSKITKS